MNLIAISENVLVNPYNINAVERKRRDGKEVVSVFVGNRSYELKVPVEEFLSKLKAEDEYKQHWAG